MLTRQLNIKTLYRSTFQRSFPVVKFHFSQDAHQLFDQMPLPNGPYNPVSSMLNCIHQNHRLRALEIFRSLLQSKYPDVVNEDAIVLAIKACLGCPGRYGEDLHGFAVSSGFISYRSVSNSLMNFYCKLGKFDEAVDIFNSIDDPDVVSYNTVLAGFQVSHDALSFASQMNFDGILFDAVSFSTILSFCLDKLGFLFGYQLHSMAQKSGLHEEIYVGNAFITMYSRWGLIPEAERVFVEMLKRDLVSWNALLSGYSQEGSYGLKAIQAFHEMMTQGMKLDHVSFTSAVSACGHERNLEVGRQIHGLGIKVGVSSHVSVGNVLMSTYAKSEAIEDAKRVFHDMAQRNVVSWTTVISMNEDDVLPLFHRMRLDGIYPNEVTLISVLHAITNMNLPSEGHTIHGFCIKTSFISELNVSNSLVTMYAKFQNMGDSVKAFEENQCREIVSWNALIAGYSQNGLLQEALETFSSAVFESQPNEYTFGSVLSAIGAAEFVSLRHGQRCHSHLFKLGLNTNPIVSGALLDMYAKRGNLSDSTLVFQEINERSQVTWTTIMSAHARHGDYESVMHLFKEMECEGATPDSITLLTVLTACGRQGMVDAGQQIFNTYVNEGKIEPSPEHYACMVDMLGRVGKLNEAEDLIHRIPAGPGLTALQSLLGACRIHGDVEMGQRIGNALIEMEPEESGSYVLMSNLYATKGEWEKVSSMRRRMRDKGVKKVIGFSWVDVGIADGSLYAHGFSSDDMSHPQCKEIYEMAKSLGLEMKSLERESERLELISCTF